MIYWSALLSAIIIFVLVFVIGAWEMYVRWKMNQNFTLLGGFELEALTVSATALILGLMYWYRPR